MTDALQDKFGELNLTQDELKRFSEAMKKEEFRKLLIDYAEELQDPKNRELYESEITKLENERGMNVLFIHPEPGYCVKTTQTEKTTTKKCFINICKNSNVEKPTCSRTNNNSNTSENNNKPGMYWSIPHTCTPPRDDYDNKKEKCIVYDVVFNPDAYRMGETNKRFNLLLRDTAMNTVEKNFGVKLDRANAKILKNLNFKGRPTAATIKKPMNKVNKENNNDENIASSHKDDPIAPIIDQLKEQYYENQKQKIKTTTNNVNNANNNVETKSLDDLPKYTEPIYKIVHRGQADFQDCVQQLDNINGTRAVNSLRPRELFISIELPLCKSSEHVTLDIFEKSLYLESNNPNYKLNLNLPFPINENESKAKFDKSKRCLNLTLPVIPFVAEVDVVNSGSTSSINSIEMMDDKSFTPSSSSSSSRSLSLSPAKHTTETPIVSKNELKYNLPQTCSIKEYKNRIVLKMTVFNYDKDSIVVNADSECSFNIKCESLSSSGSYIQYHAAYVRFYYVKSLQRQRNPLSIYDKDLNPYNCIEFNSKYDILHLDSDNFEVRLCKNKNNEGQHDIEVKKALFSLKPINLDDIEDLSNNNDTNNAHMIIDINQDQLDREETSINDIMANNMSKKEFMLNFQNIANSDYLDEDDDDSENVNKKENDTKQGDNKQNLDIKPVDMKPSENETSKSVKSDSNNNNVLKEDDDDDNNHEDEKDYLKKAKNDYDTDDALQSQNNATTNSNQCLSIMSASISSTNDSFNSSLSSSSTFNRLKGILKKPRSCSESESTATFYNNSDSITNGLKTGLIRSSSDGSNSVSSDIDMSGNGNCDLSSSKKSVSFNKQVVRNVFKPGSTVIGMKKPGSNKNKKKNKRNRTVSDPSHDSNAEAVSLKDSVVENSSFRNRSISESSDDSLSITTNSNESLSETTKSTDNSQKQQQQQSQSTSSKNKKKKKKKSTKGNTESQQEVKQPEPPQQKSTKAASLKDTKPTEPFNMETMLEWKNQGRLPLGDMTHATNSAIKLKNSLINDLDD